MTDDEHLRLTGRQVRAFVCGVDPAGCRELATLSAMRPPTLFAVQDTSWIGWEGWGFIGTVAQVVSLVTIAGAALQYVSQRRQMPAFLLDWRVLGTATISAATGSGTYHLVEFRNIGRGVGHLIELQLFNAQVFRTADYRARSVLGAGDSFSMLVTTPDVSAVWVRAAWRVENDQWRVSACWAPLVWSGPLYEQWLGERAAHGRRSLLERWWDRSDPRGVEPQGATSVRIAPHRLSDERIAQLFPAPAGITVSSSALADAIPANLPFIPNVESSGQR